MSKVDSQDGQGKPKPSKKSEAGKKAMKGSATSVPKADSQQPTNQQDTDNSKILNDTDQKGTIKQTLSTIS